jgi:glycine hydroxymethyltransferase
VASGTDSHVMCIDLRSKGITGKVAEAALDKAGITANKNTIPFDPEKPFVTSGLRIGTPAVTTRGMKEEQMAQIAHFIDEAICHHNDETYLAEIAEKIKKFLQDFPLYPQLG